MWSRVHQYDHAETQLPSRSYHGDMEDFINMVLFIGYASCFGRVRAVQALEGPLVVSERFG